MSGSFIGFFMALAVVSLFVVGIIKVSRWHFKFFKDGDLAALGSETEKI